ncbi:MAG: hypothetical protein PHN19_05625 [Patescibacteria group bacterium]|nr:hypothetical protein [Patescibacteria group bacterium]
MTEEEKKEMRIMIAESIEDVVVPATKSIIKDSENKILTTVEKMFVTNNKQIDKKLEKLEKKIDDTKLGQDEVLKEIQESREDREASSYVLSNLTEKGLDHEKRIVALEEKIA